MFDGLPYKPPWRMFWRCRHCQAVVLKTKDGLVTPALGYPHVCQTEDVKQPGPGTLVAVGAK